MAAIREVRPPSEVFADPITSIYAETVDRILINIASHFDFNDPDFGSTRWQFRMLAEMGQLNKENLAIISTTMANKSQIVADALERAALSALTDLEPTFAAAVKAGYLSDPGTVTLSPRVREVLSAYAAQAETTLNLVNTKMLESGQAIFRQAISNAVAFTQANITPENSAQILNILNQNTADVLTGAATRQQALRTALKSLSDAGIVGFVDRAGRKWSPEAYVNMDMRTTCGNAAMQSVFTRNEEYGNDLIWWPILATARPGCYPWQGKVCSTSNRSGIVNDLRGGIQVIYPLNQTTYGQPDGIGGINCHHKPANIFIPGMSMIRGSLPSKGLNDERYAETQQSRRLERSVRDAKRRAVMADAAGDKALFEKTAKLVKQREANLKNFFKETGQPFYSDRVQVFGFDRSAAQRTANAAKRSQAAAAAKVKAAAASKPSGLLVSVKPLKSAANKSARSATNAILKTNVQNSSAPVLIRSRAQLVKEARSAYLSKNASLGSQEAGRRFDLIVDGNTDAQMRDYVNRYGSRKIRIPKGGFK